MTRVCRALIGVAFNELGMHKVQISAATGNRRSRALCERLGATLEGVITRAGVVNGVTLDHAVYRIHRESTGPMLGHPKCDAMCRFNIKMTRITNNKSPHLKTIIILDIIINMITKRCEHVGVRFVRESKDKSISLEPGFRAAS